MGLIVRCNAAGEPTPTGRRYLLEYTDPETGEVEILDAKKRDDVKVLLKDCPKMQQYLLKVIKGEIEAPKNSIPNEEMDSEMSDEDFEAMMNEENYGEDDGAEEIESTSWDDM